MARNKRIRKKQRVQQTGTAIPNIQQTSTAVPQEVRNFGLLKVRSMKIKQSQATVLKDNQPQNFSRMTGEQIIRIIQGTDMAQIRALSKYFAQTNGIYARAVRYLADIYRYDFMLYPNIDLTAELDEKMNDKILKKYDELLGHFDISAIQMKCRKWANQVCLEGVYYGYICDDVNDKIVIQDLPTNYCRSRFTHRDKPLVEFNVTYFDKVTSDPIFREMLLNLFPDEIKVGYRKQLNGKLPAEVQGDDSGWILLDINRAFKFNFYDTDLPPFLYAIPALMNLAEVQDLEKEKLLQELQKILVQTFDLDKNGQLPFTMPELQRLNQNAIDMVGDAVGVSVLSTVADVHLEDLAPEGGQKSEQSADAAESAVYNDMGISMNLFNTEGNLALEKSIITDQAFVKQLMLQFEFFFNEYIAWKFNKAGLKFKMKMLDTTIFNHVELSDKYKDLTKIGFSRFLPMVALGHAEKEVTSMAKLEQQMLQIDSFMLPPFSSNTMSSETWAQIKEIQRQILNGESSSLTPIVAPGQSGQMPNSAVPGAQAQAQAAREKAAAAAPATETAASRGGRPPKPNDQKSEKTIANNESAN